MKLVTVMLCSVLLVLGQVWLAPVASASVCVPKRDLPCCRHGVMPCCVAKAASTSQPVSTLPVRTNVEAPLLVLLALGSAWHAPEIEPSSASAFLSAPVSAASQPLYERDCARLL